MATALKQSRKGADGRFEEVEVPFSKALKVFEKMRDGDGQPDRFYLGEMGGTDRYAAHFDELMTISVPQDSTKRKEFLSKYRKFTLSPEFVRDMHVRLFKAFASLGFDDFSWWSTKDLQLVVGHGDTLKSRGASELERARQNLRLGQSEAPADQSQKKLDALAKAVETTERNQQELAEEMRPYEDELKRRSTAQKA